MKLHVAPRPCNTCPYVTTTPAGIWHPDEYEKLARYDDSADGTSPHLLIFQCHQSRATGFPTACRGWLSVHRESPAARVAVLTGAVTDEERYAQPLVSLFGSGREARDAGLAGIESPPASARRAITRLLEKGVALP